MTEYIIISWLSNRNQSVETFGNENMEFVLHVMHHVTFNYAFHESP